MENRRIFTFGCSFTQYMWPTWADMILYGNDGYNLGYTGSGYDYILYRLLECDRVYSFTPNDVIIIVFTTPIRFDINMAPYQWKCYGQAITSEISKYNNELYSIEGLINKSFYNILLIDNYLKSKNLKFYYGSLNNMFTNVGNYFEDFDLSYETIDLINYVKEKINIDFLDFFSYLYGDSKIWPVTKSFTTYDDYHPRPKDHYSWVKNVLMKKVDIDLNFSLEILNEIENFIDSSDDINEVRKIKDKFPEVMGKFAGGNVYLKK